LGRNAAVVSVLSYFTNAEKNYNNTFFFLSFEVWESTLERCNDYGYLLPFGFLVAFGSVHPMSYFFFRKLRQSMGVRIKRTTVSYYFGDQHFSRGLLHRRSHCFL
jgi:hypothetical protein